MKKLLMILLAVLLLAGCSSGKAAGMLTAEEAEEIALENAGLTREDVTFLRSEYEVDRGVPQYEVDFIHNGQEYDYHISAENGQILEYSQDKQ